MTMLEEFKAFIRRGSVVDLAVGLIVGAAFGKIVSSLVADVIMPPIGLVIGGIHFTSLRIHIGGPADAPVTINIGNFIQTIVDFVIIAFCIFLIVKGVNAIQTKAPETSKDASPEEKLLTEIRDLLKARAGAEGTITASTAAASPAPPP